MDSRFRIKFKREILLNYGMNRWGLNKVYSVGPTSELIRACAPKTLEEWEEYYFTHAKQKKKNGIKITREYIKGLGQTLYIKITEVIRSELDSITEEECIDYAYNLVLNRTYEGYKEASEDHWQAGCADRDFKKNGRVVRDKVGAVETLKEAGYTIKDACKALGISRS